MNFTPPVENFNPKKHRVLLPRDFEYQGRPMQEQYRTPFAIVYQQIPAPSPRYSTQPYVPIYNFLVFKIQMNGDAEVLGELIFTTQDFTQALEVAAKQQG
jgi:hypothetical protein